MVDLKLLFKIITVMSGATAADPYGGMTTPTVTITAGTPF